MFCLCPGMTYIWDEEDCRRLRALAIFPVMPVASVEAFELRMMKTPPIPTAAGPEAWVEPLIASLHAQRDRVREFLANQQERMQQAGRFVEDELERLEKTSQIQREELEGLRIARDAIAMRLAHTEAQLAEAERRAAEHSESAPSQAADADLRHRYESMLEELRQAKNKITELQQQLVHARSTTARLAQQASQSGRLDWESEKKRILAALETDFRDDDDSARQSERISINEALRSTEEVVAAKDREIKDLKERLETLRAGGSPEISQAEAVEQLLDRDAVIQQERQRLERLQAEWREKLQQAEIEIALERAKIARQRADLESTRTPQSASPPPIASTKPAEPSVRGRWLARLGLTDADREPRRH